MGFPAPDGPPHHLTNPFEQDLVYLMGGERSDFDIGYFPRLARRMIFSPTDILCVRDDQSERMTLGQWVAGATSEGSTDL